MIELKTFEDVLRAVADHVDASKHQDIRASDDPRAGLAGYCCHDCKGAPWAWWMAPATTIHDLPKRFGKLATTTTGRQRVIGDVIKMTLAPKAYRPTAWERVMRL